MKKSLLVLTISLFSLILTTSCSLDYGQVFEDNSRVPEFIFNDVKMTRIEEGSQTVALHAGTLEQYKNSGVTYGKQVTFENFDKNGKKTVQGNCTLLSADTDTEIYTLYDNITLTSFEQDIQIIAENLKWNNKNEQLTSGANDKVIIKSGGFDPENSASTHSEMSGTGFSASSISLSYRFVSDISGTIETDDSNEAQK